MRKPKSKKFKLQNRLSEVSEIELLESWIDAGKPQTGSNPLALPPLPEKSPIGRLPDGSFSPYSGAVKFSQLPLSKKTKDGLAAAKFSKMSEIQRASLPHSLCGRDIIGASKTGSGKTLAFIIPVLEKLYRARWGPEDGVGCIIISPNRLLGGQTFKLLKSVQKYHGFSVGLLIGGHKDVNTEKEYVNELNILVCTPGRLLQHMDETPNFECSQLQAIIVPIVIHILPCFIPSLSATSHLEGMAAYDRLGCKFLAREQVLVLDEADRVLDEKFKREVNPIVSQLPKYRQNLLFSATQTKRAQDLARLGLKDPEYINVHEDSATATPGGLQETAMIVPLDQKLDMLWSFIKAHLNSRILVFLSTCKQVKFTFEAFKKLRPGIPLKCLHGRMKQDKRAGIYNQFCDEQDKGSVLFCTDVASRGLDFNKAVDWVVQVDCPDDVESYIHRVGRTARFHSSGRSVLFLTPLETKMLDKLKEKIPIVCRKSNAKRLQPISGLMTALLVQYPNLQQLAQRAFVTYVRSIHKQHDKEVFDVNKLPIDAYSASLGLPMIPKVLFLKQKEKDKKLSEEMFPVPHSGAQNLPNFQHESVVIGSSKEEELESEGFLLQQAKLPLEEEDATDIGDIVLATMVLKKKKLKINMHRPGGTRVVFDDEGNTLPPLAKLAETKVDADSVKLDKDKVNQRYAELREQMKVQDKEDKALDRQRRKEKRLKEKMKWKRSRDGEEQEEEGDSSEGDVSNSDKETNTRRGANKKSKVYFDSDNDDNEEKIKEKDNFSLLEQEELALKLLSSMHS